jgi:hypothetical protein
MKSSEAYIGARVALFTPKNLMKLPLTKGNISGPVSTVAGKEVVVVEWDSGNTQNVTLRSLMSEADFALDESRLLAEQARLLEKFDTVRTSVADKLNKAAKLILEANSLAMSASGSLVEDFSYETTSLENALLATKFIV